MIFNPYWIILGMSSEVVLSQKITREIFSTRYGYQVKETYENGVEVWTPFYSRSELRAIIISYGLCESIADRMISQCRYRKVEEDPNQESK